MHLVHHDLASGAACAIAENGQTPDAEQQPMLVSQHPRLWLSGQGAVSPLHYDSATSFLTQACTLAASS